MSLWSRLSRTFHGGRHDEEIEEELRFHLAMKQRDGVDSRAARVRFGNPSRLKEETRAQGILVWVESLFRDIRYGLRQLRRSPALTVVVVLSLALGIGANSAIFSLVDAALLKALPVKDPRSLKLIEWTNNGWPDVLCNMLTGDSDGNPTGVMHGSSIAPRVYRELEREQSGFASLSGFSDTDKVAVAPAGRAVRASICECEFFPRIGCSGSVGARILGWRGSCRPGSVGRHQRPVLEEPLWWA